MSKLLDIASVLDGRVPPRGTTTRECREQAATILRQLDEHGVEMNPRSGKLTNLLVAQPDAPEPEREDQP